MQAQSTARHETFCPEDRPPNLKGKAQLTQTAPLPPPLADPLPPPLSWVDSSHATVRDCARLCATASTLSFSFREADAACRVGGGAGLPCCRSRRWEAPGPQPPALRTSASRSRRRRRLGAPALACGPVSCGNRRMGGKMAHHRTPQALVGTTAILWCLGILQEGLERGVLGLHSLGQSYQPTAQGASLARVPGGSLKCYPRRSHPSGYPKGLQTSRGRTD